MAERNADVPADQRIQMRIGINVGDIIIDDDDIFGDGVNVAARLQTLAEPGGVCVSRVVHDEVFDKLSFTFDDLGAQEVKNIVRPVKIYRVALDSGTRAPMARKFGPRILPMPMGTPSRTVRAMMTLAVVAFLGVVSASTTSRCCDRRPSRRIPADRRMTFAVLPFLSARRRQDSRPGRDRSDRALVAVEERKVLWAQVATPQRRTGAGRARCHQGSSLRPQRALSDPGQRDASGLGYNVEMLVVDGATERVLGTESLFHRETARSFRDGAKTSKARSVA